ncbi:hypothetical protein GCM10010191_84590 [Actinomadura vinacea]|uniref:Uncharacterized protein n=1 Tax=Actinomadura vinacea TaxID=115336 RepID=A0ABN3K976_9ACTN
MSYRRKRNAAARREGRAADRDARPDLGMRLLGGLLLKPRARRAVRHKQAGPRPP